MLLKLRTDVQNDDLTILQQRCDEWDFSNPPFDALELAKDMIALMYKESGLGLAANQVGMPYRLFVMRGTLETGDFACFNPRIVYFSEDRVLLDEACLSYPGVVVKVKRSREVRLRFSAPDGNVVTQMFTGITARVVQHEMDHLNGILFYHRANKYHRDQGFKNRNKVKDGKIDFHHLDLLASLTASK